MSTRWFFQTTFFLGCGYILHSSDCLVLSVVYEQEQVEFTCEISPYTLSQKWLVDSAVVYDCGAGSCAETPSNPQQYDFTNNLVSGIFTFKIDPITSSDEGKKIGCYDGTMTEELTISTANGEGDSDNLPVWAIVMTVLGSLILFFLGVIFMFLLCAMLLLFVLTSIMVIIADVLAKEIE